MVAVPQQYQFCDDDDPFVDINVTDEDMPVLVPVPRDDEQYDDNYTTTDSEYEDAEAYLYEQELLDD